MLTLVRKSIDIKTPVENVFTYFARPEHVSDQIKNDTVGMTVVPMDIKEGMGVGTTFRIIGDFSGKRLEWDCETTEFVRNEKIVAKQIEGPFKHWEITNEFESLGDNLTRITMSVDYEMPFGPLGAILDKAKFAKSADKEIKFNAKVIIDCSGFQSIVGKMLGLVTQWERFGAGAEYEVRAENVDDETWWLMVGQKYSPAGYAWIFPVGDNVVRIGVGVGKPESDVDPTERLNELMENKEGPIKDLGTITKIEFHYGLIPNDGLSRNTVYDNFILVGDSAGQANPLVLEGIRYAIRFGRVAGRVASDAVKNDDTSENALRPYETEWKKAIESKINSASKVQNRWIGLSDEQWDKELDVISELSADEFLDFIRADFGISKIVRLATHHPKLAVRQLFSIVKGT